MWFSRAVVSVLEPGVVTEISSARLVEDKIKKFPHQRGSGPWHWKPDLELFSLSLPMIHYLLEMYFSWETVHILLFANKTRVNMEF